MCRDEPLQVLADPFHDADVSRHPCQQHPAFERRDDESRQPNRIDTVPQLRPDFSQESVQLFRPAAEHVVEPSAKPLVRVGELASQIPERRARAAVPITLQVHQRVDEQRQPVDRLDHRLAQDGQATLREPLELPVDHRHPQRFLRREVVIEVALPAEPGRFDQLLDRGMAESTLVDHSCCGVQDGVSSAAHDMRLGPIGPNVKCWVGAGVAR